MKKIIAGIVLVLIGVSSGQAYDYYSNTNNKKRDSGYSYGGYGTGSNPTSTNVDGYIKRDGTYVEPHQRSRSNGTQYDNWSTKGNSNPYTGKSGTKNPWK